MAKFKTPTPEEFLTTPNSTQINKEGGKKVSARSTTKRYGNVVVSSALSPQRAQVAQATHMMSAKGIADMGYAGENSVNNSALNMLGALGCSVDYSKGSDYSLQRDTTDTEVISNPNISDRSTIDPKTKTQTASGKFTNSNDAFYELDGDIPQALSTADKARRTSKMTPDVITVAVDVFSINMDTTNPSTLSEFK